MVLKQKKSSADTVLIYNVVLVLLLSNAMLQARGQFGPVGCLINCGIKLISCATGCGTDPLCLLGCGTNEIGCVMTCNGSPVAIALVEMAGRKAAGTQIGAVKAVAIISSSFSTGEDNIRGYLEFLQDSSTGVTHVEGRIAGLTPGVHGLHIHAFGDTTRACSSSGSHFRPIDKDHRVLSAQNHRARYLGKITAGPDGIAEVSIRDEHIPLTGPHSVLGCAAVVDADAGDLGRGGE